METAKRRSSGNVVVFDSGIGGLNLLYACSIRLPELHYYYLSDRANMPYGNRTADEILMLTLKALYGVERLFPKALVVACNTVTVNCIEALRYIFPFPVIGVQPAVKTAAANGGRVLVLATEATANSAKFCGLASSVTGAEVKVCGCKNLAKYIEDNVLSLPEKLPKGLLTDDKCDAVVLGCTHYEFIKEQIKHHYNCPIYDGTEAVADHFVKILGMKSHLQPPIGKFGHLPNNRQKITFLGVDKDKNCKIFEKIFKTKVLNFH